MLFARRGRRGSGGGATSKVSGIRGFWRRGAGRPLFGLVEPAVLFQRILPVLIGCKPLRWLRFCPPFAPDAAFWRENGGKTRPRAPTLFFSPPAKSSNPPPRLPPHRGRRGGGAISPL